MSVATVPGFYTLTQAVDILGPGAPSVTTLRKEIAQGRLHAKRIGRCLRVTDVELTRWALDTQFSTTGRSESDAPLPDAAAGSSAGAPRSSPRGGVS